MNENAPTGPKNSVILVFGLGGVGKSTLARKLSEHLDLRLIHPSSIIRDLVQGREPDLEHTIANDGFWEQPEGAHLLQERLHHTTPVDVSVHEILLQEVQKGDIVIDTWSLPWLTDLGFRIKLEAPLPVRARRAARRAGTPYSEALTRIRNKDEDTRNLFLHLYGFDISANTARFDLVLDTSRLHPEEVFQRALLAYLEQL